MDSNETEFLSQIDTTEGWKLLERFSTLVRESGTPDEFEAAAYIEERLRALEIPFQTFQPELYISLPRGAELSVLANGDPVYLRAKTPSFSLHTGPEARVGEILHVPAGQARDFTEMFHSRLGEAGLEVEGKIVVTEGFPLPATVRTLEQGGAEGAIFIHPGRNIHEMICTTIWGNPTLDTLERKPRIPVVSINRSDGDRVIEMARDSATASLTTRLDEGWRPCKLPVVTIEGHDEPELFLLVHGHYDSWHVGIGDNATGNAVLLELARIFHEGRRHLRRTLKIAWWPGHSTGRYAGSTWFADTFGTELRRHCIGQVNIDSPGCRQATSFREVMWMMECDELCRQSIGDRTGRESHRVRPLRAGDYSFNQIGLSSFFMLLSNRPPEEREKQGLYPVGGCGGDIAWHTEEDTLEVADRQIMHQDLEIYLTALCRVLNARVLPYDFRRVVEELHRIIADYTEQAAGEFSLQEVSDELAQLDAELAPFYARLSDPALSQAQARRANRLLLELARRLVPLNYSRGERFDHDPAEPQGHLPKLREVSRIRHTAGDERKFLMTALVRQRNKVVNALWETTRMVRSAMNEFQERSDD